MSLSIGARLGTILLAVAALSSQTVDVRIVTDGHPGEWKSVPVAFTRAAPPSDPQVRLIEVRAIADSRNLHLLLTFNREVNLLGSLRTFAIGIDADGDAVTDVTVELGGQDEGAFVRRPGTSDVERATSDQLQFLIAPVHAATQFELRVDRGRLRSAVAASASAGSARLRIGFDPPEPGSGSAADFTVPWPPLADPARPGADDRRPDADPLARSPAASFRVVSWNVNGIPAAARDDFLKVFRALDPDVLFLSQVPPLEATGLESWLPVVAGRAAWRVVSPALAVRGNGVVSFTGLPYPPGTADSIAQRYFPDDASQRAIRRSVIENSTLGSGALVVVGGRRILSVPLHLYPGGADPDGPRDLQRVAQATAIATAVRRTLKSESAQAVIVGGDLNLVGTRKPLDILQRDLDLDGSALAVVDALQLNGAANATWRAVDPINARFPPGRLGWLLYSDSSLELLKSFVFDASDLAPTWLARHGLAAPESSRRLSDHLPIVADFRWR